jgi:hypothetical protein
MMDGRGICKVLGVDEGISEGKREHKWTPTLGMGKSSTTHLIVMGMTRNFGICSLSNLIGFLYLTHDKEERTLMCVMSIDTATSVRFVFMDGLVPWI